MDDQRASIGYVAKKYGVPKIAAEIGAQEAIYSEVMLYYYPIKYLILVEPYLQYFNGEWIVTEEMQKQYFLRAIERMRQFQGRYGFLIMTSEQASELFPDNFFDLVYIDADHKYESAKQDIALWYPKTKLLSGHDYCHPDVQRAIKEFVSKSNLNCKNYIDNKEDWFGGDWLIEKT